eukprot:1161253-Amphidinium_carterae.1
MRMRDEEQRAKQLVINPSATRTPQAASGEYEADQWTAQKWEEYEAEVAAGQRRPTQSKPKLCSAYASKDGCPKGALCVMASKGGHPRMRDKCLQCGSEGHMYKACTRPAWKSQAKQYEADNGAETTSGHQPEPEAAQNDADKQDQDWYVIDAAKGKAKGKGKKGKGKGKSKSKDKGISVAERQQKVQSVLRKLE